MYPVRPLRFLRTSHRKLSEAKQAEKTAKRRGLEVLPFVKLSAAPLFFSGDYSMTFPADKAENSPHFKKLSAEAEGVGRVTSEGV